MIIQVTESQYFEYFVRDSHTFISRSYLNLHRDKPDEVLFFTTENRRLGLIAGRTGTTLHSPYAAPFGGFHYKNQVMHSSEIDQWLENFKEYCISKGFTSLSLKLPPDLYEPMMNAKVVSYFWRNGVIPNLPELTQWADLTNFDGHYPRNVREILSNCRRKGLTFSIVDSEEDKAIIYSIIRENRVSHGRPIYLTLEDLSSMNTLFPVDFGAVRNASGEIVAGSVFYRVTQNLVYAVYWADSLKGRTVHAMDYLADSLWIHYKQAGFSTIDLSISTESGVPNPGLLRFKESHNAITSLRYGFNWNF